MEIKKICVLGAGIMGAGIAQVSARAGFEVIIRDMEDRFVENGLTTIKSNLDRGVSKGKMDQAEADTVLNRITGTTDLTKAAAEADLIIEAIIEQMDVKRQVFQDLDNICKKDTLLAFKHAFNSVSIWARYYFTDTVKPRLANIVFWITTYKISIVFIGVKRC